MLLHRSAIVACIVSCVGACDRDAESRNEAPVAESAGPVPLTPELASKVLAQVGERKITLGDYVMALDRLDRFSRLRYQTPERRRQLLDEMINVELLAREAERQGLDQQPETRAHIRMLQRQELMRQERARLPALDELPMSEVKQRYEAAKDRYTDPERRRVAVIRLNSRATAERVLSEAKVADARRWGELARKHSTLVPKGPGASKNQARPPLELEGDLGLVSAPGTERGDNPRVPEPVRQAVFGLATPGEVHPDVVADGGAFYVVRLVAVSPARRRTFEEAESTIRVELLQERLRAAEAALVSRLRSELEVVVDEAALSDLNVSGESR